MSEDYPWYQVVEGPVLVQGDILDRCPVVVPSVEMPKDVSSDEYILNAEILEYDVIIMSQSCDLEYEKIQLVLVCPHWSLGEFADTSEYFKSTKGKEDLRRGNIPGYHVLKGCDLEGWKMDIRVVDFRNVYSLPYQFIKQFAASQGERLRLLPPYREHLSQAFARFFMRVGLPVPIVIY